MLATPLRAWLFPLAAALAFTSALAWLHANPPGFPDDPAPIAQAGILITAEPGPPMPEASWAPVSLPHDWRTSAETGAYAWIRLRLPPAPADGAVDRVLYLPQSNPIEAAWLDGQPFAAAVQPRATGDLTFLRPPRLIPLPPTSPDGGTLRLRVLSRSYAGYMGPAWVAPRAQLAPAFELRSLVEVGLQRLVFLALLGFALFMLATWLARPSDRLPAWLALAFGAITLGGWSIVTLDLPLPTLPTAYVGTGVLLALITKTTHAVVGISRPRIERLFWGWALLSIVTRLAVPAGAVHEFFRVAMTLGALPLSLYPLWVMLHANATRPNPEFRVLAAAGIVYEIASLHDLGWFAGFVPRHHSPSLHFALGVMVVGFGWIYVRRFISALDDAEQLNRSLDRRVREKERELDANYQRLAVLERERAISNERTRMMEELHDGMGGHISSALAQLRDDAAPERATPHLRRAMQDMRLLVHSLDRETGDLATLLGLLRDQLEPLLDAAGIRLLWRVQDTPEPVGYGPEMALHVTRIVQQAVANAAEHSKARTLTLRTDAVVARAGSYVSVAVEDDGRGLDALGAVSAGPPGAEAGRHHGLRNMQRRAERIEATLDVASLESGTRVELRLPLA